MGGRGVSGTGPASFRRPLAVTAVFAAASGDTYPVCPRCAVTLEREYQRFCDRCGQRLDWTRFDEAAVVRAPHCAGRKDAL